MKIAFTLISGKLWTGGMNYLKNLLYALHKNFSNVVQPILFIGENADLGEVNSVKAYLSDVVQDSRFTRWSFPWITRQISTRALDRDYIVEKIFQKHQIDVVFHSGLFGAKFSIPCVNWIADFQHIHMPEFFTRRELKLRDRQFQSFVRMSRRIVVSSECARKDFESFLPAYKHLVEVINFVARILEDVYSYNPLERLDKYGLPEKFFHLPNQFWKHKNHILVVEALKLLKEKRRDIYVVCTGNITDYRNPGYFDLLKKKIAESGVDSQIALLGFVPSDHLYALMRQSIAILNPSLFEGWSTTVEEAKSIGKKVLLSDIPVHREQNPSGGIYFNPTDPEDLAEKMVRVWEETQPGPDFSLEENARSLIHERVRSFAKKYVDVFEKAIA